MCIIVHEFSTKNTGTLARELRNVFNYGNWMQCTEKCDLWFRLGESPYNGNVPAEAANKGELCERSISAAAVNNSRHNYIQQLEF